MGGRTSTVSLLSSPHSEPSSGPSNLFVSLILTLTLAPPNRLLRYLLFSLPWSHVDCKLVMMTGLFLETYLSSSSCALVMVTPSSYAIFICLAFQFFLIVRRFFKAISLGSFKGTRTPMISNICITIFFIFAKNRVTTVSFCFWSLCSINNLFLSFSKSFCQV